MTLQKFFKQWSNNKGTAILFKKSYRVHKTSYKEFANQIKRIATLLKPLKKGDMLMLWAPNSPEWAAVFFACALKGVIVIPVDFTAKPDFAQRIQSQVKAKLLVCHEAHKDKLKLKTVTINEIAKKAERAKPQNTFPKIKPSDLAEIIYTSGTTGDPKGVMLTHENLTSNLKAAIKAVQLGDNHTFLCVVPLSHMLGQSIGLLVPLALKGAAFYLETLSSAHITNALQRENVTVLVAVPRVLEAMRDRIVWSAKQHGKYWLLKTLHTLARIGPHPVKKLLLHELHVQLGSLDYLIVGGAFLDPDLESWWDSTGMTVIQGYGLTETSPVVSYNAPHEKKIGCVGQILPGTKVKISVDGEICVKGPSVFKGYYKRPKKTTEALKNGWFMTGDIGYVKKNFLYLQGRKKDMIVTAEGLNIYPEDIEAVLQKIPGVKASAVIGWPKYNERVHAFLILDKTNPKKVLELANKQLSQAQQIQSYTLWPKASFPRTTTMKVKKFELMQYMEQQREPQFPESKDVLTRFISDITGVAMKKVTTQAKLSQDCRLSSLDRVELIARLEQELHVDIDETLIGPSTTVEQLREMIKGKVKNHKAKRPRRWTRSIPCKFIRAFFQPLLVKLVLKAVDIKVKGKHNLKNLKGPVLIVANHTSHLDTPIILKVLPSHIRRRLSAAAWEEYFKEWRGIKWALYQPIAYNFVTIMFNVFLLPQKAGFRKAFEYAGELVDHGWSILLYPEGERTLTGKMVPFKLGVGILAPSLNIPILPLKLEGLDKIWAREKGWLGKGPGKITIGKPFFPKEKTTIKITKEIQDKIRKL